MRRLIRAAPVVLGTAAALAAPASAAERGFTVAGFDRVRSAGSFDVAIRVGGPISVRASGPQAALDRLEVVSEGGQLRIGTVKAGWGGWRPELGKVVVTVSVPALRGVSLAGSGDVSVDRARAARFDATLAGSGDLTVGAVQADAIGLSIAGSGNLSVGGKASSVKASIAGSGDIEAAGLTVGAADVSVAGSGNVALTANGRATVSIVGSGDVTIAGRATCTVSKRGSGGVRCGG